MIPEQKHHDQAHEARVTKQPVSRRGLLRRAALGVTGIGLATLVAACGGGDEEELPGAEVPTAPSVREEQPAEPGTDDVPEDGG